MPHFTAGSPFVQRLWVFVDLQVIKCKLILSMTFMLKHMKNTLLLYEIESSSRVVSHGNHQAHVQPTDRLPLPILSSAEEPEEEISSYYHH